MSENEVNAAATAENAGANPDAAGNAAPAAEGASSKSREPRLPLPGSLQEIVGSLLFASPQPLSASDLRACVRGVAPEEGDDADVMNVYQTCTNREIEEALRGLEKALDVAGVGFKLVCSGGTYRMQTAPACGRYVRALLKLDRPTRLSRASLETLAIVAYRQPITKAEIEEIRGVGVDTMIKTLVDLQLVRLVGKSELPGHPFLYGTTPLFLEHFGLASLEQLNEIDPTLPRSDPRARAKLFKKEEPPKKPAEGEGEGLGEGQGEGEGVGEGEGLGEGVGVGEGVGEDEGVGEGKGEGEGTADEEDDANAGGPAYEEPEEHLTHISTASDEDDDIVIDDTPDEFDDEDDDDEDEGEEEEEQ